MKQPYQYFVCKCGWSLARMSLGSSGSTATEICRECESPMNPVEDERQIEELQEFFFGKEKKL